MLDFLEPDNIKRNAIIFIAALLFCGAFAGFYTVVDNGCSQYLQNLKECKPYKCKQRVMGFESGYVVHKAIVIGREIVGLEKDKFFDTQTCNIIETDDVSKKEKILCKYTDKTKEIAAMRAAILFGKAALPVENNQKLTGFEQAAKTAAYSQRSPEQITECSVIQSE